MKKLLAAVLMTAVLAVMLVACGSDKSDDTRKPDVIIPTDAQGEPVYPTDSDGYPVYPTDAEGEPVYATDAQGNDLIATDSKGTPITGNNGATGPAPTSANPSAEDPTEDEIPVIIVTIPDIPDEDLPILD